MYNTFIVEKKDVFDKIEEISNQIEKEKESNECDKDKITKLMFEQLLNGLYLQTFPMN